MHANSMRANPYVVFELFCVFVMMGSECVWGLGEGSNFQLVRWPQMEIQGIFKQKEQFDPNFC